MADPGAGRTVRARVVTVPPKITTSDLAAKYPAYIVVDRKAFTLRFFSHLKPARTYPIAVGLQGLETPGGPLRRPVEADNPSWYVPNSAWAGKLAGKVIPPGPHDPIKARWMAFNGGAGIHGIDPRVLEHRPRRLARLRADADPRRHRPLRPLAGRHAGLRGLRRWAAGRRLGGRGARAPEQLAQAGLDPGRERADVRGVVAVAGDAEEEAAVVGEDRNDDPDRADDRDVGVGLASRWPRAWTGCCGPGTFVVAVSMFRRSERVMTRLPSASSNGGAKPESWASVSPATACWRT